VAAGSSVYNPLRKFVRNKRLMYVAKNIVWVMVAFLAPLWFPALQKLFTGQVLTNTEWLIVILFLAIPTLVLWWCEKQEKRTRIDELKQAISEVLKEKTREKKGGR